ncbi:uncharacterized protein EV420DRAFT_1272379 [Desarmillaria tabescens]|uniref:Uncharacterized protein n=1 Tax=Armillaria tabescens TaxID=1929756 RepID=A0AA39K8V2_ARMTA|nr:uncharacterized protein EV420DRAFT_1272379 [Desarmillaria tabescens]KAK0455441.1 hypothetical protein EV420DRAFT_1272379 [Desarmillaria tabescens]
MPSFAVTIQDYSPLVSYDENWRAGNSRDSYLDRRVLSRQSAKLSLTVANRYSDNSMMVTNVTGASATFWFNGTGVSIYGAKRSNHGSYQVTLDGTSFPAESGYDSTGIFQTLLFSSITLDQGSHELILTNQGVEEYLDIDFITWQTSIGGLNESLTVNTVQDTDPSFTYTPSLAWSSNPEHSDFYFGSTGHSSVKYGSFMTYNFSGEGVSLYGPVGPNYAAFSAQLDDGPLVTSTAIRANFVPQVLLYHADGLGSGQHALKVTMQPSDDAQELAVDFANVYTTSSAQSSWVGCKLLCIRLLNFDLGFQQHHTGEQIMLC